MNEQALRIVESDALVVVDVQNDFLPGGAVGVEDGEAVIEPMNRMMEKFEARDLPIYLTRDWHPDGHCSFEEQGGKWPEHCVQDSSGAAFPDNLDIPHSAVIFSKGTDLQKDAYSGFEGTGLARKLDETETERIILGGLATEVCVEATAASALESGYEVVVVEDGIRAVDLEEGDGEEAIRRMRSRGVEFVGSGEIS